MEFVGDEPKRAPIPTPLDQDCVFPSVTDVSMIFSNDVASSRDREQPMYLSYDAWKKCNKKSITGNPQSAAEDVENLVLSSANKNGINDDPFGYPNMLQLRKQVRFENSVLQQKLRSEQTNPLSEITQFEQIYMANVPNRNLDLSVIEGSSNKDKFNNVNEIWQLNKKTDDVTSFKKFSESPDNNFTPLHSECNSLKTLDMNVRNVTSNADKTPETYKEFCDKNEARVKRMNKVCSSCRCSRSEKENTVPVKKFYDNRYSRELDFYNGTKKSTDTQTSYIFHDNTIANTEKNIVRTQNSDSNEPTVKDLLKIIQQQNEQLLTLQKQVSLLLEEKIERPKTIETVSTFKEIGMATEAQENVFTEKYVTSTKHETDGAAQLNIPKKGALPKFSVDVMTSFEVSIRPQQNFNNPRNKYFKDYPSAEPKIQEITEIASDKQREVADSTDVTTSNSVDVSFTLNESVPIGQDCPSPENSIHVDMQDYSSDSDDESTSSDVEWLIYNNVMHQVENILKKNKNKCERRRTGKEDCGTDETERSCKTTRKVKRAAMRHLKRIGLELSDTDESTDTAITNSSHDYTPTEISFAVKQLLMKYLPNEQLSVLVQKSSGVREKKENQKLIKNRPEFSFATMQYMKKYNLVTQNGTQQDPSFRNEKSSLKQNTDFPKILDITALKQQPKLL